MTTDIITAVELIFDARKEGLDLYLIDHETVQAKGRPETIARYRDRIRASKPALVLYLRQCHQPEPGPRPVGDFTATVATDAVLGRPAPDPAAAEQPEHQQHDIELHPTHHTTKPLLFHQPGRGPFLIETGTKVHVFPSLFAAKAAGLPPEVWEGLGQWAAQKNVEKGYRLAWIANDLRGVYPGHLDE